MNLDLTDRSEPTRVDMAWGILGLASLAFGTFLLVFVAVAGRC